MQHDRSELGEDIDLTARIDALQAELDRLRLAAGTAMPGEVSAHDAPRRSRRDALRLAGAAMVGAVGAAVVADRAAADTGFTSTPQVATFITPTRNNFTPLNNQTANTSGFVFQSGAAFQSNVDTHANAALGGWAATNGVCTAGVYGLSAVAGGTGVIGRSSASDSSTGVSGEADGLLSVGVSGRSDQGCGVQGTSVNTLGGSFASLHGVGMTAVGGRAAIIVSGTGADPRTVSGDAIPGMIQQDGSRRLWLCIADGNPGTWQQIGGPDTAGAFHPVTPGRVYDSRNAGAGGVLASGHNRTVAVRDRLSASSGVVDLFDVVPAGATAITANVTVVDTVGAGFLTVNPGGVTTVGAATINWSATGQVLNNGVTLTLDAARQLTIICGGGGSTDVVIDVSGFYL
jgi:hypothetical protein